MAKTKEKKSAAKISKKTVKNHLKKMEASKERKERKAMSLYQSTIGIIGIGGGGGSIVGEMAKSIHRKKLPHANRIKFIVANVDYQAIKTVPRPAKAFYFGQNITHGLGCGMNPLLGQEAAFQEKKAIERLLKKCDFCILVTCLGGGTGSGAAPVFAEISKNLGILTLGICTLPFKFEGKERSKIARASLEKIKNNLNAYIVIPNQKIFRIIDQKTPIQKSLSAMNTILIKALEGLIETLYSPGLINLDFSDFRATLDKQNALTYLNCQEFGGPNRAEKAVEAVLKNPLISYGINGAERILFNIAGARDMRMSEVELISKRISEFNPQARIIFGISQDSRHKNKIKITLLAVGCGEIPKVKRKPKKRKKKAEENKVTKTEESSGEKTKKEKLIKKIKNTEEKIKNKEGEEEVKKAEKIKKIREKEDVKKPSKRRAKTKVVKKATVRRNALDLHKQIQKDEQKMLEEESKWDIPAFLRENENQNGN